MSTPVDTLPGHSSSHPFLADDVHSLSHVPPIHTFPGRQCLLPFFIRSLLKSPLAPAICGPLCVTRQAGHMDVVYNSRQQRSTVQSPGLTTIDWFDLFCAELALKRYWGLEGGSGGGAGTEIPFSSGGVGVGGTIPNAALHCHHRNDSALRLAAVLLFRCDCGGHMHYITHSLNPLRSHCSRRANNSPPPTRCCWASQLSSFQVPPATFISLSTVLLQVGAQWSVCLFSFFQAVSISERCVADYFCSCGD